MHPPTAANHGPRNQEAETARGPSRPSSGPLAKVLLGGLLVNSLTSQGSNTFTRKQSSSSVKLEVGTAIWAPQISEAAGKEELLQLQLPTDSPESLQRHHEECA